MHQPSPSSAIPIYLQLMDQVKHGLVTGALRPGEPLPDVQSLAQELVISPNTVAKAYRHLEYEGVITVGDGTRALLPWKGHRTASGRLATASTSLAFENKWLTAQMLREVAARASSARELAIAAEVQQTLLPQECPQMSGLDYAGASRPALGVGGDYYDFIRFSENQLGIAIGDVSGKGIPAALLMATLRAYLRSQTDRAGDPAQIIATLNRLLYESSSANRYATFLYAQYDASTGVLTYTNAGHNPPFVLRRHGNLSSIVRLDPCGPVIGFLLECSYTARSIVLEPGDLLLAFTDGISEAMNAGDEEWGEERLMELLCANSTLTARALIDRVMTEADAFAEGALQHDDMTVVAVRRTE